MKFVGTVYRAHNPRWAFSPLSGDGAAHYGGRFNPKKTPALYTALTVEAAWREAQQGFPFKPRAVTICGYLVDCDDILDLTDQAVLLDNGINSADLSCPWELLLADGLTPPSWILASRLIGAGISGIVVPSFAFGAGPQDKNLVFWKWQSQLPYRIEVIDDGRLPKNASSWD